MVKVSQAAAIGKVNIRAISGTPLVGTIASASTDRITPHEYQTFTAQTVTGTCGYFGSSLVNGATMDLTRVAAAHNHDGHTGCNSCIKVDGPIGSVYLLVIDQKGDPGLDISADAYNLITGSTLGPSGAPIATADGKGMGGPVAGSYAQVDISLCSVHWTGSCPANYMGTWCQ
ncbi:hypothetical protein EMMF5_006132 [Cystobasidiomycetes sp. EMM_F5]